MSNLYYVVFDGARPIKDSTELQTVSDFLYRKYVMYGKDYFNKIAVTLFQNGVRKNTLTGSIILRWLGVV
jgi:hypothetical protein